MAPGRPSEPLRDVLGRPLDIVLKTLQRRLVAAGGRVLPDVCTSTRIPAEAGLGEAYTTGCGGETRFALPYTVGDATRELVACAVDDAAYLWPRLTGAED